MSTEVQNLSESQHDAKLYVVRSLLDSLLQKYSDEWANANKNIQRKTKLGYTKVNLRQLGRAEAFTMMLDDLARL